MYFVLYVVTKGKFICNHLYIYETNLESWIIFSFQKNQYLEKVKVLLYFCVIIFHGSKQQLAESNIIAKNVEMLF